MRSYRRRRRRQRSPSRRRERAPIRSRASPARPATLAQAHIEIEIGRMPSFLEHRGVAAFGRTMAKEKKFEQTGRRRSAISAPPSPQSRSTTTGMCAAAPAEALPRARRISKPPKAASASIGSRAPWRASAASTTSRLRRNAGVIETGAAADYHRRSIPVRRAINADALVVLPIPISPIPISVTPLAARSPGLFRFRSQSHGAPGRSTSRCRGGSSRARANL